jgi:hypothetical protein
LFSGKKEFEMKTMNNSKATIHCYMLVRADIMAIVRGKNYTAKMI